MDSSPASPVPERLPELEEMPAEIREARKEANAIDMTTPLARLLPPDHRLPFVVPPPADPTAAPIRAIGKPSPGFWL